MLMPLIEQAHIDKVHFGILIVTNLTIAGITPPVGGLMYIASQVLRVNMADYSREVLPYLIMMFVLLALLICFPQISLWLPDIIYGGTNVQ
jgi:TRAP-type C4-dicarboxylate transport system permease large subunit